MEALTLLKQWRRRRHHAPATSPLLSDAATIADTVSKVETDEDSSSCAEDEGPFFDLEFDVPDDESNEGRGDQQERGEKQKDEEEEEGEEFNFPVSMEVPPGNDEETDVSFTPSGDLFFKGGFLVPHKPTSSLETKPLSLPVSLFKSAARLRAFVSERTKPRTAVSSGAAAKVETWSPGRGQRRHKRQLFTVKFRVEDVPIMSLFTRDSKETGDGSRAKETEENESATAASMRPAENESETASSMRPEENESAKAASMRPEERRFTKEVVQKYLQKIRPLYTRVYSRQNAEKLTTTTDDDVATAVAEERLAEREVGGGGEEEAAAAACPVEGRSQKKLVQAVSHLPAELRVACKNLVKSNNKSSSSTSAASTPTPVFVRRRDDSLLQQQDGIQSAIAHCKNSLNSSEVGLDSGAMMSMSKLKEACLISTG